MRKQKSHSKNMHPNEPTRKAFSENGIQAIYHHNEVLILPVSSGLAEKINRQSGEIIVSPGDIIMGGSRYSGKIDPVHDKTFLGTKLDINQPCTFEFRIPRNNNSDLRVTGEYISDLALEMLKAEDTVLGDIRQTEQKNQSAMTSWEYTMDKGEQRPEKIRSEFNLDWQEAVTLFKNLDQMIWCIEEHQDAVLANENSETDLWNKANDFFDALRVQRGNTKSSFEKSRIDEKHYLRSIIAEFDPDHSEADRIPSHEDINALRKTLDELRSNAFQKAENDFRKLLDLNDEKSTEPVMEL